jgi:hypothetical protein
MIILVLLSVSEMHGPKDEPWTTQTIELKKISAEKAATLRKSLEDAGATIEESTNSGKRTLLVKRGRRIYQKISYPVK